MDFTLVTAFLSAVITLVLGVYYLCSLLRYIRSAKSTGLPYIVVPCLETETFSQLVTPLLRKAYMKQLGDGKGWPRWCRFMIKDWSWEDKRRAHDEYGEMFLVVSWQGIICYCADAATCWDVMNRRNDFTKPRDKYKILEPYGPNVATAEGSTYRFHVRMTAPTFSDLTGVNNLVWKETTRQTGLLVENWTKAAPQRLDEDINALTLAVISLAGFGKKLESVHEQAQDIPPGYKISFLTALRHTTSYMLAILLFPTWLLDLTPYAEASLAKRQLDTYLRQIIRQERSSGGKDTEPELGTRGNLLQSVVHAFQEDEEQPKQAGHQARQRAFSEDEVMGNLFIYLLGGYETTANSIQYGLLALAMLPEIQSKVIEEIDQVYEEAAADGRQELTYRDDFEKLEYTYGFMYETFRLYPGVTLITKVCEKPQPIKVHDERTGMARTLTLPPGCRVYLSAPGVHYNPRYWEEPEELRPERWTTQRFSHGGEDESKGKKVGAADRTRQMRGTLLTFSDGARACLGRKFAQAEYMAFLAALLRRFRVTLAAGVDASKAKADLDNKSAGKITLAPLDGFRLELRQRIKT
uniref:Cytochrome P450 monooxygenase n=1 Tax=Nodulisporium sp. TaxID=1897413 RepID=A0A2R4QF20_9PEZI|nr:cytochrome P450 monooxygenase [Nodulisporium sp.]